MSALLLATPFAQAQSNRDKAARYYEDALQRYERKDIPGAIIQLKNALQIDKSMLPVQVLLGNALLLNGEAAAAEVAISEALRLGVNRAEVVATLAQALLAQGKHRELFEQARLSPAGLPPHTRQQLLLLRATAYSELGDAANALKSVEEARAFDPRAIDSWLAEVPIRLRARQLREATVAANQALTLAPGSAEAHYQKAAVIHLQGEIKPAIAGYERALQADGNHTEARLARAGLLLDLGRNAEAATDVAELQKRSPREPRAAYLRALLAERSGDAAAARAALREVVGLLDPVPIEFVRYRPQLLLLNGLAHFGLNEYLKAKPYLEAFYRSQTSSPVSKLLGQIYLQEKNPDRAIEVLEAYLRGMPGDGQALTLLATAYLAKGRHAKATSLMQDALRSKDAPEFRTALGLSLIQSGDAGGARSEFESALKKDPQQIQAALALINIYLRQGLASKAVGLAENLCKQQPGNPTFQNLLGVARAQAGDLSGARKAFEQALSLDAKQVAPILGLARIEIASRNFDAAGARLGALLRADERNVEALYDMAVLAERRKQADEARRWLEKAVDFSAQHDTRANFALVELHLRAGRAAPALEAAKVLLAKIPEDVAALFTYARAQVAAGDTSGAKQTLTNASRRAGFDAAAQTDIATIQAAVDDLPGAVYSLDKALSGAPDYLPATRLMTALEIRRGDLAKAEARARRITQIHPKQPEGYQLLGDIALARKQGGAAIDAYRQAFRIKPNSATVLALMRAQTSQGQFKAALLQAEHWLKTSPRDLLVRKFLADGHASVGDFSAAKREYEGLLKLAPTDAEALNNLANVLFRLKDPAAAKVAEQALALEPSNALVIDTLGWILFNSGQSERALQLLRDARLREPANPEIRFHLAMALAKAGRKAEAREELAAALRYDTAMEGQPEVQALQLTLK